MVTSDLKSSSGRSNQVKFLFVVVCFFFPTMLSDFDLLLFHFP